MKKWIFIYLAIGIAAVLLAAWIPSRQMQMEIGIPVADAVGKVDADGNSWAYGYANTEYGSFLLKQDRTDSSRAAAYTVLKGGLSGGKLEGFRILDVAFFDAPYYLYQRKDGEKGAVYGMGRFDEELGQGEQLAEQVFDGVQGRGGLAVAGAASGNGGWLDFGAGTEGLYCVRIGTDGTEAQLYFLDTAAEEPEWVSSVSYSAPEGHAFVRTALVDGVVSFCLENGEAWQYKGVDPVRYERLEESPFAGAGLAGTGFLQEFGSAAQNAVRNRCFTNLLLVVLPFGVLFLALGVLILNGLFGRASAVARMFWTAELVLAVVLAAGSVWVAEGLSEQNEAAVMERADRYLQELSGEVSGNGTLTREKLVEAAAGADGIFSELLLIDMSYIPAQVAAGLHTPAGVAAAGYYKEPLAEAIVAAEAKPGLIQRMFPGWRGDMVAARRVEGLGEPAPVLAATVSGEWIAAQVQERLDEFLARACIMLLAGTLVLAAAFLISRSSLARFARTLEQLARGKEAVRYPVKGTREVRGMWKALQELGRRIEEANYQMKRDYLAYRRFAPGMSAALLGKTEIGDVAVGDMAEVEGTMILFSRAYAEAAEGREVLAQTAADFSLITRCDKGRKGLLVSQDASFTRLKLFFQGQAAPAVEFGIEYTRECAAKADLCTRPQVLFIHRAKYLYGVTGAEGQALPFAYSPQEAILEQYLDPLRRTGVKLVLTEPARSGLETTFDLRYIGFLSGAGQGEQGMKLYECLDARPDREKALFLAADGQFQKALELFYSDDFYLARNTFNEVLKQNPEDRIARWYLFNCEYQLNHAGIQEVAYGLFENRVLEQQYQEL